MRRAAFTLIEMILVMALLATMLAVSAPILSRSIRQRGIDGEATRFLALTESARNEAISQGVPMTVWIEPDARRFGCEVKEGYEGTEVRQREYDVNPDVDVQVPNGKISRGIVQAVEFSPDGAPGVSSVDEVRFSDRFGEALSVVRTSDGWSYEIAREEAK